MAKKRALDVVLQESWACTPEYLETVIAVASRAMEKPTQSFEAVLQKTGEGLPEDPWRVQVREGVAIIDVHGGIFRHANIITEYCGATSVERLAQSLAHANASPDIHAIILDLDSPGGEISGIHEMAAIIHASEKPVYAYVGNLAASAGYWLAAAAKRIVVDRTARLGSIGVLMGWTDNSEARKTAGLKDYEIVSSQSPQKRLDPASKEGRADIQGMLDGLAEIFIADVATYRSTTAEDVTENFGRGGVLLAEQALAAGMADSEGSLENLISELAAQKSESTPLLELNMPNAELAAEQIDRNWLAANKPELLSALLAEGKAQTDMTAAQAEAVKEERARIAAIDALGVNGHDELVKKAKVEGTSPETLAMAIVKADNAARAAFGKNYEADAAKAFVEPVAGTSEETEESAIINSVAAFANAGRKN